MLVFLIGYMGGGKTTVGKKLASRLGCSFLDLDHLIEEVYKKSITDIFKEEGEIVFRESEKKLLQSCFNRSNTVISCGGGTPCFFDNLLLMKQNGLVVYLKLSPGILFRRLKQAKTKRPLLAEMTDLELMAFINSELEKRAVYYEQADLIFKGENLNPVDLASEVRQAIEKRQFSNLSG